jgi:hypothetical protein
MTGSGIPCQHTAGAFDLLKTVSSYKGEAGYKAEAGYRVKRAARPQPAGCPMAATNGGHGLG